MTQEIVRNTQAWDKMPQETPKAYAAFQVYCQLTPYGEGSEKRSLENVQAKLGLASDSSISGWSAKNNWVERAVAYDSYHASRAISITETALYDYQQSVVSSLSAQLVVMNEIIEKMLKQMRDALAKGEGDPNGMKKLAEVIRIKDDLARRLGKMPTQFSTERAEEQNEEERVYVIGGKAKGQS